MDGANSAGMGVVDGFCCLGDVLSVDGDAGVAVEAGVHVGWSEFRQLVPLLTGRDVSLIGRGAAWQLCARWCAARKWGLACREEG